MDANAPTGQLIGGRYRLERRIASGGMASVWEAVDDILARRVAVKLLHPHLAADEQFVARFRREAVAAARLAHPSIVSIFDTCSDGAGIEAIVMELVPGTTLRGELDRRGRFEPADAVAVVAEIADALQAAHDAGIVHRDVKPANVLLSTDGRVLVADFGIAKAVDGLELTNEGMTLGTAKYLAPEQVEGRPVDGRADVYATGVILYELVCGKPPFAADTEAATALARLHRAPDPPRIHLPDLDPELEAVILHALARDPEQRTASARALRDELRGLGRGGSTTTTSSPPPVPPVGADATGLIDPTTTASAAADPTTASTSASPASTTTGSSRTTAPPPPVPPVGPQHGRSKPASPPRSPAQPSARRRRWGLGLTLGLVLAAAVIAIVLATRANGGSDGDRDLFDRDPSSGLAIASVSSFDPEGDDGDENEELAAFAVDGDPTTVWRSSCYGSQSFGNLKAGVGLILALDGPASLGQLAVAAAPDGWSATVHVAAEPSDTLEGWGPAVGTIDGGGAEEAVDLDGAEGGAVLVFFTALGSSAAPDCSNFPFGIAVSELVIGQD